MGHSHHNHNSSGKNLRLVFFLNLGFAIFEIFGGFWTNSVAILSDALHDLGDSLSLGMAWFLNKKSKGTADSKFSFGYIRFSLLGALINSIVLITGSVFVVIEAVKRLQNPEESNAEGRIVFALIGIVVNGYAAFRISGGKSLNEKVVKWHLLEDVLGWVAVLIAAIVLLFKDIPYIDPALSMLITAYILYNVWKRLKETLHIFLQGVPVGIDIHKLEKELRAIPFVESLHHTHIWSLDGEHHVFTTHLKLAGITDIIEVIKVKDKAREILTSYGFAHFTIETEINDERCALTDPE